MKNEDEYWMMPQSLALIGIFIVLQLVLVGSPFIWLAQKAYSVAGIAPPVGITRQPDVQGWCFVAGAFVELVFGLVFVLVFIVSIIG